MSALWTFVGTNSPQNQTGAVQVSSGTVTQGSSGLFAPGEVAQLLSSGLVLVQGPVSSPASQLSAPIASAGAAGALTGVYRYLVTFVTAVGETTAGPEATVTLSAQKGSLTGIPTGSSLSGVLSRNVYRTAAGGGSGTEKLVANIADNTTTSYIDNTVDGSLGVAVPTVDTSVVSIGENNLAQISALNPAARSEAIALIEREVGSLNGATVARVGSDGTVGGSGGSPLSSGVVTTSALQPSLLAQVEPFVTPYTVYVSQSGGSDSNAGNSPGQAFQTLGAAINALQQIGNHPGRIELLVAGGADFTLTSPVSIIKALHIEARGSAMAVIDRGFDTLNGRSVWDAVTTAAGGSVSSATAAFTNADNGRIALIYGAGVGGGTYYDFLNGNPPSGTVANLTATTAIARNATTDPHGVKMSIVGDWNRVVTDASMTAGSGVITSPTASWTIADIGTEVVVGGGGQGHQAIRTAIKSVQSATQATGTATASFTVSSARCAIGVNFGDLFCFHVGTGGLRNVMLQDTSSGRGRIGAAIKVISDDGGSGSQLTPSDLRFEIPRITSSDAAGAWEHIVDCDGSWNQNSGGPGCRRVFFFGTMFFGSRAVGETIRLVNPVHWGFLGGGSGGTAPTSIQQGIVILDPQNNGGGRGGPASQDVNFAGCEGDSWSFYSEGWNTGGIFDRLQIAQTATGRRTVELSPTSKSCAIVAPNHTTVGGSITNQNADVYDAGVNNRIVSGLDKPWNGVALDQSAPVISGVTIRETVSRLSFVNASQAIGVSGTLVLVSKWLPGGFPTQKLLFVGGGTALAWGSGWTGPHFIYGIYDPDGNLFGQSADTGGTQTFNGTASNELNAIAKDGSGAAISTAYVPRSGMCHIGLLINSGTGGSAFTYPTFAGFAPGSINTLSPALCGTWSVTALTALPTTIASGGSLTAVNNMLYGGVG